MESFAFAFMPQSFRTAGICLDYGSRVQKSLFMCDLTEKTFGEMWRRLHAAVDPETDTLLAFPLCRSCLRQRVAAGKSMPRVV